MTPDEYCRRYGRPASHHRMTLASPLETSRKFPPAWGLIAAVAFGVVVIAGLWRWLL